MLTISIPYTEYYDERTNDFIEIKPSKICLEHSLVSISKWESKWHKPFLGSKKNDEEVIDYIKKMTITQNVKDEVYNGLKKENFDEINSYINDSMTATFFYDDNKKKVNNGIITSELIYYWMISNNIPHEFEKWHLNRLLTLIRVCGEKNKKPKKMSKSALLKRNKALNEARRKQYYKK